MVFATTSTPQVTAWGYWEKELGFPTGGQIGVLGVVLASTCRPRMAGAATSMDRFLGTYPGSLAKGVKPAGVGTVVVATELVVVTVVVVSIVTMVVVVVFRRVLVN